MEFNAKKLGLGIATAFLAVSGCSSYVFAPRVTDRDAAIKIVNGRVTDANVERGKKLDALLPQIWYVTLSGTQRETVISATEKDAQTVRTAENARIYGTYTVAWRFNKEDRNFGNVYTQLKIDEEEEVKGTLDPKIAALGISAIIEISSKIKTAEINSDIPGTGQRIARELQDNLNALGYTYIQVMNVIPSGVGLSRKANQDLEALVSEQRKLDLQRAQGQTAEAALDVSRKQSAVTAAALEELRKQGVPEDQLLGAYYLQLMRDNDKIGIPGVPGPIPGTGVGMIPTPSR